MNVYMPSLERSEVYVQKTEEQTNEKRSERSGDGLRNHAGSATVVSLFCPVFVSFCESIQRLRELARRQPERRERSKRREQELRNAVAL